MNDDVFNTSDSHRSGVKTGARPPISAARKGRLLLSKWSIRNMHTGLRRFASDGPRASANRGCEVPERRCRLAQSAAFFRHDGGCRRTAGTSRRFGTMVQGCAFFVLPGATSPHAAATAVLSQLARMLKTPRGRTNFANLAVQGLAAVISIRYSLSLRLGSPRECLPTFSARSAFWIGRHQRRYDKPIP